MPFKPQSGGEGLNYEPLRELANSGTEFNYRAEVVVRVAVEPPHDFTDEDADKIADALERRRRRREG